MNYTYSLGAFPTPSEQFNRRQLAFFTAKKFPPYLFSILITNLCSQHHLLPTDKNKNLANRRNEASCLIS